METISSVAEMTALSKEAKRSGKSVGFVPTMGALHPGHLSLVNAARAQANTVVTSIFVNPAQFGPKEDFGKYPRTLEKDSGLLAAAGVDYLFAPSVDEMYPKDACTWVMVEKLSDKLDGGSRPGHFRGVTTVVSKLFNIVLPDLAFFGQKDAAQVAIVRKMVRDLNFDVHIVVCPTVREKDGLAMSSRNVYLSPEQRQKALVLYRSLMRVQMLVDRGEKDAARLIAAGKEVISEEPSIRLDYFEIVDNDTLEATASVSGVSGGALVAVAAFVGETRLIDNIVLV
jgi:pantoate--beta-alanine ligase